MSMNSATFSGSFDIKQTATERKRKTSRLRSMLVEADRDDVFSVDGPIIGDSLIEAENKAQCWTMRHQRTIQPTSKRGLQTQDSRQLHTQDSRRFSKNSEVITDLMYTLTLQNKKVLAPRDQEVILNTFGVILLGHAGIKVHEPSQRGSITGIKLDQVTGGA